MDKSALARVERQRAELEANIAKFRKSLRYWQTLEIDYEGLREEFLGIPEDASREKCLEAARDSKPELVNDKEVQELLLESKSRPLRPAQVVDLLSKRIDYVFRNVETIRKQLSDAERKRNALLLAEEPDHRDEAGLPLAEIVEELDDSGKVISSKVQTPGSETPQLLDVLKKAGVENLAETDGKITESISSNNNPQGEGSNPGSHRNRVDSSLTSPKLPEKKTTSSPRMLPTNPDDTPVEAEHRQEMLEYSRGMDEVGAIVAELELEEAASDVSYDEDDLEFGSDAEVKVDQDFEEDSEDETGKSKHSLSLSRGYEKRMAELKEKLGLRNIGPEPEVNDISSGGTTKQPRPPAAEAARNAAISRDEKSRSNLKSIAKKPGKDGEPSKKQARKKSVAFSSELDIAREQSASNYSGSAPMATDEAIKPRLRPIHDSIVERTDENTESSILGPTSTLPKAVKESRFKATRQAQPQTPMFARPMKFPSEDNEADTDDDFAPKPPANAISRDLVERPAPKTSKAPDPDDFSDEAHHREIAKEYQQHRMKRIHAQDGGFVGNSEDGEITPLEDEETGRRVSRFKAARVNR